MAIFRGTPIVIFFSYQQTLNQLDDKIQCRRKTLHLHARYMQPVGLGKPAYLQACFAGPSGNSWYRYLLLALSLPRFLPI